MRPPRAGPAAAGTAGLGLLGLFMLAISHSAAYGPLLLDASGDEAPPGWDCSSTPIRHVAVLGERHSGEF